MPGKLTLTITAGPNAGKAFVFEKHDTLLFGRMDDCHACLPEDQQISRHHFLLEVNPPESRLRDLGSRNGTSINGQRYGGPARHETPEEGAKRKSPQVDLSDGDEIQVGRTILQVRVEESPASVASLHCQHCGKEIPASREAAGQQASFCQSCQQPLAQNPSEAITVGAHTPPSDQQAFALSDYTLGTLLGMGGMGAVYLARHKQTGEQVAVKVMRSKRQVDEQARQQFLREIGITRTFQHPHLVQFLGSGSQGEEFYCVLEYCEGGSVADLMQRRGGRLQLAEAAPLLLQALEGLTYVHAQGFVHRDLKPQNILLAGKKGQWSARLSDLGLAKSFEQAGLSGMTATGDYAGSFPFTPREQVINFKYVKPDCDVWAMGATCYYLLTGAYPRDHQGKDPLLVILEGDIIPLRQRGIPLPSSVVEVIERALASKASERYQHAGQMYEALVKALAEAKNSNAYS
ncbi:FHA domain-containing serine/threonine-protein kinase [Ktedonobacter racemifer]|uniref:Serine/threonine protein kinase with FHA domain n=1 Tax=Ktedonobacter racemifer DSM 44963 TaxID=485913 RepID=D6TDE8_KTERA|nr:FHA domain-containing serine/threonine-protein kinase [Ktedonobacter racemifer]EFH88293.1 serine/threonine protein kinase with FHA domain [Ktedonobacter racemifer DSM 44963]